MSYFKLIKFVIQWHMYKHVCMIAYPIVLLSVMLLLQLAATPGPVLMGIDFTTPESSRGKDPPEVILSFNALVAPPTFVTCEVDGTPVDVADLSREVILAQYLPPNTVSPETSVTVTLRTRQAGHYQCTVSVFRASGSNLTSATTSAVSISGKITSAHLLNNNEIN